MKLAGLILFFIFTAFSVFSLGKKEKMADIKNSPAQNAETSGSGQISDSETENTMTITGKIQIYGNEPHTYPGIVDENGIEYAIYSPSRETELRKLQGYLIEFSVIFLDKAQDYSASSLKGGTVTPVSWKIIQ